jgi:integrase/recombinase XerD
MTTPSRAKYIRDLAIRGRAERTQQSYSRYVSELARYYNRSPELISYQEVADWLYYLIKERKLSASSVNIAVNAVRFLYGVTLERNTDQLMASVPRMKHAIRRAEIYARSEVEAILSAPRQPRDRVFLMTVYACGLRLAEARHLKTTDIDRARMQLRVRKGKGGKERVLPLSKRLLKELGDYWRAQRQGKWGHDIPWLFLGVSAPNRFVRPAARTSFIARSKRAACGTKAAFTRYATIYPSGLCLPVARGPCIYGKMGEAAAT